MTEEGVIKVLVAEDHPMMVTSIVAALSADPGFDIVGTVSNGDELVAAYREKAPDVVLTDQRMPGSTGIDALRRILELDPTAKVLVLSDVDDNKVVAAAMQAGATGYVLKRNMRPEKLGAALRTAATGHPVLDETTSVQVMNELRSPSWPQGSLTSREIEVIQFVSQGSTNKQVGAQMHLSEATVKTYLDRIYAKLGVNDRAAAVRRSMEAGLIS